MAEETKVRIPLWLYPSTRQAVDANYLRDNCKSHSEYIEKAIRFYTGYLQEKDLSLFLSDALLSCVKGTVQDSENRLARMLFKLTAELGVLARVVATYEGLDPDAMSRLRGKVVEDVKRTNGAIKFEDVVRRHQQP